MQKAATIMPLWLMKRVDYHSAVAWQNLSTENPDAKSLLQSCQNSRMEADEQGGHPVCWNPPPTPNSSNPWCRKLATIMSQHKGGYQPVCCTPTRSPYCSKPWCRKLATIIPQQLGWSLTSRVDAQSAVPQQDHLLCYCSKPWCTKLATIIPQPLECWLTKVVNNQSAVHQQRSPYCSKLLRRKLATIMP